uniref:MHC class I-like antigen recognition-like domain-containing protein n=1 Tax=Salarias fasciatus TaxID=181472 RepID=A0A672G0V3_SALFA
PRFILIPFLLVISAILSAIPLTRISYEIHSLKHLYTELSEVPHFPEFLAMTLIDGIQITHYDSNTKKAIPKQDWANKVTEEDPQYWEKETDLVYGAEQWFNANIETMKQQFNQTGGLIKLLNGFHQFGYDGEDFISLDLKTQTWIPLVPQAVISKEQWDKNKAWLDQQKHYLTQECPEWLKKFLEFGRSSLMRKGKMFGVCLSTLHFTHILSFVTLGNQVQHHRMRSSLQRRTFLISHPSFPRDPDLQSSLPPSSKQDLLMSNPIQTIRISLILLLKMRSHIRSESPT